MRIDKQHQKVGFAWVLCAMIGFLIHQSSYTPTKPFVGFWTGQSVVDYGDRSLAINMQLVIDDAELERGRLIANFEPANQADGGFQANVTSNVQVLNRSNKAINFSLTNLSYTNREALEIFIDRAIPTTGHLLSGSSWAANEDEIFIYITLSFGEKMGIVLRRHN